jgi:hypothetical protein
MIHLPRQWRRAEAFRRAKASLKRTGEPRRKLWALVHRIMEVELPKEVNAGKIYRTHSPDRKRRSRKEREAQSE